MTSRISLFSANRRAEAREKLLATLAATVREPAGSPFGALKSIAETLTDVPGVAGVAVVAFDKKGELLAVGKSLLRLDLDEEQLAGLTPALKAGGGLCRLKLGHGSEAQELEAIAASSGRSLIAAVLLAYEPGASHKPTEAVAEVAPWLVAAVTASMRSESAARVRKLHDFARCELGGDEPNLDVIAREVCELFGAAACTILLEEKATGTLRLSATTDASLGSEEQVVYDTNEGLTGWVFARGESLRLARADERRAVRDATGLDREGPRFAERAPEGETATQFLGVPIRAGERTFGVIRMSRRSAEARFTGDDEEALQFLGDWLGIALKRTWNLLVNRTIEESASLAIAITRREPQTDGTFVPRLIHANPAALEMLGYEAHELQDRDATDFYAPGAYEEIYGPLEERLLLANREGRSELGPVESSLLHKDGSLVPIKISYRILADRRIRPAEMYTIGIFRERIAEARAQAKLHRVLKMLEGMGIAYFRSDFDGNALETSDAEAAILGYTEAELLELNRAAHYENAADREKLMRRAQQAKAGELLPVRQPLRRKDGTKVFTAGYMRKVQESLDLGRKTVEGLYRDVTRRLELQSFIDAPSNRVIPDEDLFEKLKEREQRQHDYVKSLGHQLITPLGSLVGNLDDLRSGLLSDKSDVDDSLRWVIGQTKQCMRMVRNFSYLGKILRQEPFRKTEVSIAKLCIETKLDFQHLLDDKPMRMVIDSRSLDTHLQVSGHGDLLRQVMVNLVDNAIKYSRAHSKIEIRGMTWPRGRVLEVSSEGLPIPKDARESIFERGFRTERAKAVVPHGTGFGLWLVRRILESHDAKILCDEVVIKGRKRIVFRITFPHPAPRRGRRVR